MAWNLTASPQSLVGTQKNLDKQKVLEYARAMKNGANFPPIIVNDKLIINGHHRAVAAFLIDKEIEILNEGWEFRVSRWKVSDAIELFNFSEREINSLLD
jgi:hypothetical protein